jgi:hypothetical protein
MIKRISKKVERSYEESGLAIICNTIRGCILVSDVSGLHLYASYSEADGIYQWSNGILDRDKAIQLSSSKDLYVLKELILEKLNA